MVLKNWGNGLKQRGCNAVWKRRQRAWASVGAARGWSGLQISFSSVRELGARANIKGTRVRKVRLLPNPRTSYWVV